MGQKRAWCPFWRPFKKHMQKMSMWICWFLDRKAHEAHYFEVQNKKDIEACQNSKYGKYEIEDQVNFTVYVPKVDEHFVGSLAVIPLQLLGYYVSVAKGLDVDKPRNLAKSVTVE